MSITTTVENLSKLDSCAVSDALDRFGINGVAVGIKPVTVNRRVAGRVITLKLKPSDGRPALHHLGTNIIDAANSGDVIVVDHGGRVDVAGWGGILSTAAALKGVRGVVVDGACRDLDDARDLDFPIYASAAAPITARGRVTEDSSNQPITIAGIKVRPNDWVVADSSGVVFVPQECADEVISFAGRIAEREKQMISEIRSGRSLSEVMNASYESMLEERDV